jgi:hypothetical protein
VNKKAQDLKSIKEHIRALEMQERKEREKEMRDIARYEIKELKRMERAIEENPAREIERIRDRRRALEKKLKNDRSQKKVN